MKNRRIFFGVVAPAVLIALVAIYVAFTSESMSPRGIGSDGSGGAGPAGGETVSNLEPVLDADRDSRQELATPVNPLLVPIVPDVEDRVVDGMSGRDIYRYFWGDRYESELARLKRTGVDVALDQFKAAPGTRIGDVREMLSSELLTKDFALQLRRLPPSKVVGGRSKVVDPTNPEECFEHVADSVIEALPNPKAWNWSDPEVVQYRDQIQVRIDEARVLYDMLDREVGSYLMAEAQRINLYSSPTYGEIYISPIVNIGPESGFVSHGDPLRARWSYFMAGGAPDTQSIAMISYYVCLLEIPGCAAAIGAIDAFETDFAAEMQAIAAAIVDTLS